MSFGIDATSTSNHAALKKAGVQFCCRYLSSTPWKNLTAAEAKALRAHDIAIVTVWETTGKTVKHGRPAGIDDAVGAQAELRSLAEPKVPVIFAIDYQDEQPDFAKTAQYFDGVAATIGWKRSGAYGGFDVIKMLFDAGKIRFGWQTYAWSGGRWDKRAQLRQYLNGQTLAGNSVDYDMAMTRNFGQWDPPIIPLPKPTPLYTIDVYQGKQIVRVLSSHSPGLSLVRYNVARHEPTRINIVRR